MADTRKRWVIYYDETMERNMNRLKVETAKKDGVPVNKITIRRVVDDTTREKYVEYIDKQNNRARITDIIDRLTALELAVKELAEIIRGEK